MVGGFVVIAISSVVETVSGADEWNFSIILTNKILT